MLGLRFTVWGSGFRVWGFGSRVQGLGCRVRDLYDESFFGVTNITLYQISGFSI
jgi:hypothetical protein